MCTIAWGRNGRSLWTCFNRDEQRTRAAAELPNVHCRDGERLAYARDPVGRGSWFVAAERGFVVALLNHYPVRGSGPHAGHRSRGQLVLELAAMSGLHAAEAQLERMPLSHYAPFDLVLLAPDCTVTRSWDGMDLKPLSCPGNFWTTSSHQQDAVRAWRTGRWLEQLGTVGLDGEKAGAFLRQLEPEQPDFGFTMDRDDTGTVSQICVRMDASGFVFSYRPRAGRRAGYLAPTVLRCPD